MCRKILACGILFVCAACSQAPIDQATFEMQKVGVKAAYEASSDAKENWADYSDENKAAYLEANEKAWESLNKVYNPVEE